MSGEPATLRILVVGDSGTSSHCMRVARIGCMLQDDEVCAGDRRMRNEMLHPDSNAASCSVPSFPGVGKSSFAYAFAHLEPLKHPNTTVGCQIECKVSDLSVSFDRPSLMADWKCCTASALLKLCAMRAAVT